LSALEIGDLLILVGLLGGNAMLAWLHVAETNHSPRHDLISAYAHSRYPGVYAVHNLTFVISGIGGAVATHTYAPHSTLLPVLCLLYSLGIAVLAIFPMDISATVKTIVGALHVVGVVMVFLAATLYSLLFSHFGSAAHSAGGKYAFDFVTIYLIVGIIFMLIAQARKWTLFGLIERVAAAGLSLWFVGILFVTSK
jgi:Protein of unknown function (DUF998)